MKYFATLSFTTLSIVLGGCQTNLGIGIISGTGVGAAIGGTAGGGKGALIGSAAGFVIGGIVGAALDQQDRRVMEKSSPRTVDRIDRDEPLTLTDIIKLSQSGITDETIIDYIKESNASYMLSQAQIRRLKEAGVSPRVIDFMIASGR